MPFDTLLFPVSLGERLVVAQSVSSGIRLTQQGEVAPVFSLETQSPCPDDGKPQPKEAVVRLGWLSFDFNSHPTCHLAIALLEGIL